VRTRLRVPIGSGRRLGIGASAALHSAVEAAEPGSTLVAGALRVAPSPQVVLTIEDAAAAVLGAVVLGRHGRSRWEARPLLVDPASAPVLGRVVHLSPARRVLGIGPHVAPLAPHLPRSRSAGRGAFLAGADLPETRDLDPRSRAATPADLPALVDLFAGHYSLGRFRGRAAWRRLLERAVAEGLVVVADGDGVLAGGIVCGAASRRWAFGTDATVRPEHRGQGLSWAMADRLFAMVDGYGLRFCGAQTDDNPMDPDHHYGDHGALGDELWELALDPHLPRRWARRAAAAGRRARRRAPLGGLAAQERLDGVRGLDDGGLVGQLAGLVGVVRHGRDRSRRSVWDTTGPGLPRVRRAAMPRRHR